VIASVFYNVVMGPALELKGKVTFGGVFGMFDMPFLIGDWEPPESRSRPDVG
jgi:hypothetical protein